MAFNFNLAVSVPGTANGPIATTLKNGVVSFLGEDADGLTPKQAGELACRRFLKGLHDKEVQRVDVANATATDRASLDAARGDITALEANIKTTEQGLRAQAEADWA